MFRLIYADISCTFFKWCFHRICDLHMWSTVSSFSGEEKSYGPGKFPGEPCFWASFTI